MPPTFLEADSQLVQRLQSISKKSPRLVKSSTYPAPADQNITVRSWKMNEFKYYDVPSPFPTLARGIFTVELDSVTRGEKDEKKENDDVKDDRDGRYRIVARGYDKFFNIGEVPWCTWQALKDHTAAPYTLSLKSNGCIIFIAALTPSKLLITSKHSIGPLQGVPLSHAQAGEGWLRTYLAQKGRKEDDLAACLWENNWTAVAELCDDSFEEHVLPYPPEKTGLHLHGLNVATKEFNTVPHSAVDAFAEEWGFIKTESITLNSIDEVQSFTTNVGLTGVWNNEPVEGFVVRTHVAEPPPESTGGDKGRSPYPAGSSFFFKVKFDEPYMMYRDWREVTKSLLSLASKGPMSALSPAKLPKSKMRRPETKLYVKWVIDEIKKNKSQFDGFAKGKGIIATRERFLKWLATEQGEKDLDNVKEGGEETVTVIDEAKRFEKTIIAPVAIPGCGKTAIAVALAHIFGFGHTQSDDVQGKKPAPQFLKNVSSLLQKHDVVIADKNNHLKQHRTALRDLASKSSVPTRVLALNWAIAEKPQATIHRICGDRVTQRGDNHQTLRADSSPARTHEEVIWMFIKTTEELSPEEVDAVVDMDMEEGLEDAVKRAIDGMAKVIGVERPSEEKVKEALDIVNGYKPAIKKADEPSGKKGRSVSGVRYYGLLPELDVEQMLEEQFTREPDGGRNDDEQVLAKDKGKEAFEKLKKAGRVTKRPHVTVVHSKSLPEQKQLWDASAKLNGMAEPPLFKGRVGHMVWNERVMALTVDDLDVDQDQEVGVVEGGTAWLEGLGEDLKGKLHVTVGTKDGSVPPVEARDLVEAWRKGGEETKGIHAVELGNVILRGRLKGLHS